MLPAEGCVQRIGQRANVAGCGHLQQRAAQQFPLFEAGVIPAAVGVADQTGGVDNQDETLRIADDLAGKIAFALQLGLIGVEPAHIQHEPSDLQQSSRGVVHAKGVNQHVDGRIVLAPQRGLKVAQMTQLLKRLGDPLALRGRKIELRGNVDMQKFLSAGVAEHANHGVIDFNETAFGSAEEQSFLNVVE